MIHLYKWEMSFEEFAELDKNDFYNMHKVVWGLFGDKKRDRKFLYRILYNKNSVHIIIQSLYQIENTPLIGVFSSKDIQLDLKEKSRYQFSATLNPVVDKSRLSRGKRNSNRVPLTDIEDIQNWVIRLFEKKGLKCTNIKFGRTKIKKSKRKKATLSICDVVGVFEITNKIKALGAFKYGLGKSKSFGCGLLFTKPLGECLNLSDDNEDNDDF